MAQPAHSQVREAALEEAVLSKAVVRAAHHMGLKNASLARVLGLSPASISRLRAGTFSLSRGSKAFELGQLLIRLFRSLDAITGGDDTSSRSWLASENAALGGTPAAMIETIPGLVATVQYVDARRAVV